MFYFRIEYRIQLHDVMLDQNQLYTQNRRVDGTLESDYQVGVTTSVTWFLRFLKTAIVLRVIPYWAAAAQNVVSRLHTKILIHFGNL